MAQIKTIDGERHTVNESLKEITKFINSVYGKEAGLVHLTRETKRFDGRWETDLEPVTFIIRNIVMYY